MLKPSNMPENDDTRRKATARKRDFRARNRTYTFSISKDEAEQLEKHAGKKGFPVPEYIKALLEADMNGIGYVVPNDGRLQAVALLLRRIGVNINQTVHWINANREVSISDLHTLQRQLMELETKVLDTIKRPDDIISVVREHLNDHPNDRTHLMRWLHDN